MYQLTAADFADTGQWRLLLKIGNTGLEAFLENTLHPEIELQPLCTASWLLNKDELCRNIEDAVYRNPRLLDDFATRIILFDMRTLFIPTEVAEESIGAEEEIYKKVYVADDADIMSDRDGDITAAWSLAPGVKSFLMRTFPGARISCNLMELLRKLRKDNKGITLHALARQDEVDLIMLSDEHLISASTHEWRHTDDIAYLVVNLIETYGYASGEVSLTLSGATSDTEAWEYIKSKTRSLINEPMDI